MITEKMIGLQGEPVMNIIEAEAIRRFTDAIGVPYTGEVPPTFLITLKAGGIPGFDFGRAGLIHGEQEFQYFLPIRVGDKITCTQRLKNLFHRKGKLGKMLFVVQETEGRNPAGELVYTSCSIVIAPDREVF